MVGCNTCGEEFSRPDSLSRHLKRKYSCMGTNTSDRLINKIINDNDEKSNDNLPIQLWSGKEVGSPSKKSNEVLFIHEAAKN